MYSGLQFLTLMVWIRINWFNNIACSKLGKRCWRSSETQETILLVVNRTGGKQNFAQAAIKLTGVVTDSGRASTVAATDAATPTLRRIKRAAIAAATPVTYHVRELLLLIHEHLQACGLAETATVAQLTPLPLLAAPSYQSSGHETLSLIIQWPSVHTHGGFMSLKPKLALQDEEAGMKYDKLIVSSSKMKQLAFSSALDLS